MKSDYLNCNIERSHHDEEYSDNDDVKPHTKSSKRKKNGKLVILIF